MKKYVTFLLLTVLVFAGIATQTGCQTIEDFADDNPQTYALIKGASKVLLLSQVSAVTSDLTVQVALRAAIEAAYTNDTPQAVASALTAGVASIYPNDEDLQALIIAEFADILDETDGTPESGAERAYQLQLSDALRV